MRLRARELPPRPPARIVEPAGPIASIRPRWSAGQRPGHRASSAHLRAAYPFQAEGGLGPRGVYIGRDAFGGSFVYDPWELYGRVITSPNMAVIGQLGKAKSSLLKSYVFRQSVFGRRSVVMDVKREYGPLVEAMGGTIVRLTPYGDVRLNPLTPLAGAKQQARLLRAVCAATLRRELSSEEEAALSATLRVLAPRVDEPTLPDVVDVLLHPTAELADPLATQPAELARAVRDAALALMRLCEGDLRGMFDGPTSAELDFDAPLIVLDLADVESSEALAILITCATAWLQAKLDERRRLAESEGLPAPKTIMVIDEAWRVFPVVGAGEWLQAQFKLSRKYGQQNIVVMHRFSDPTAAGAEGSRAVRLAEGLLADTDTFVLYGLATEREVAVARELLSLTATEAELLLSLGRGVALWRVGQRSFLVAHRYSAIERSLIYTDEAMAVTP